MPKKDKEINTPEAPEGSDAKDIQKWSVWTQGPKDAKETKRKFQQTTPGQVRDYKHFVSSRRFTQYEQFGEVQPKNEDAPANSVAGGGVDMAPNAKGTKVFMKKFRVDGRTKEYREANRRIKERQEKIVQRQVQAKLDMFGVHANPFAEETENKKYFDTKEGSIEDAIISALTNFENPNKDKETLTLPNKKDVEVEEAYKSPLDSPKAKAAREKLQKTLKDIKKKDPDHPAVQNVKEEEVEETYKGKEKRKVDLGGNKRKGDIKKMPFAKKAEEVEVDEAQWKRTMTPQDKKDYRDGKTYGALKRTHKNQKAAAAQRKKEDDRNAEYFAAQPKKGRVTTTRSGRLAKFMASRPKKEEVEIDELSNKTMDSYAQKASASQSDAEKKQDYKTADKRISGKLRATRRKFSNDTNRILKGLKKESKETENGERDAGSDKYTNYTKEMTPGQGITSDDAKKADLRKKKEQAAQQQQLNVDEDMKYLNTKPGSIEESVLKALMPEKFTTKHEKGDKHDEVPEKKAGESDKDHKDRQAGRVSFKSHRKSLDKVDPDELEGKHKDRDDKDIDNDGDSDSSDRYLHRRRQAIASRRKKEETKESIAPKQLSSPAPAGKNVKKTAAYKSGVRRSKASGEVYHKTDTHHTGTQRHMDDDLPQEKGSGHSTYHKDTRGKKKVRGSKQAHEEVETEAFANAPSGMKFPTKGVKNMGGPKSRQLKDPKKEKMVGTKSGTKVVNRDDPKYKNAPEHESVQSPWIEATIAHLDKVAEKTIMGVKVKKLKSPKDSETHDVKTALKDKSSVVRQQARQKYGYKTEEGEVEEKTIMGVKVKKLGTQKDSETSDVKKAQSGDKDALVRQQARQKFGYKTSK